MLNPELRRNIWLDFSLHRVILTPIVIGIFVYLSYLGGDIARANISFKLASFFIFLWGIKKASETVIDEVNGNTWDFQRQTAISPMSMTFGKLIGSTLFSWYGAILSLITLAFTYSPTPDSVSLGEDIFIIVTAGLFGQSIALLSSLQILPQIRREHALKTFRYFILGLFMSLIAAWWTFLVSLLDTQVQWFNFHFASNVFAQCSLLLFTLWTLLGLQRSFSNELQYQNIPYAWIAFTLFCMFYFSGLSTSVANWIPIPPQSSADDIQAISDLRLLIEKAPYYVAFFVAQVLTYIALFTQALTTVRYKKIFLRINEKNPLEAAEQTPLWLISFVLMIVAGILSLFALSVISERLSEDFSPTIFIITSSLFTVRDVLLIHYFNFSANTQRVLGASIIYLFLLYMLIPLLLVQLNQSHLTVMFVPSWGQHTSLALVSIFVQIAIVGFLCFRCWHSDNKVHYPKSTPH